MNSTIFSRLLDRRFTGALRPFGVYVMLMLLATATLLAQQTGELTSVRLTTPTFSTGTIVINGTSHTFTGDLWENKTVMLDLSKPLTIAPGPAFVPRPGVQSRVASFILQFEPADYTRGGYFPAEKTTIPDPHGLGGIHVEFFRYIEVKVRAEGPGQVLRNPAPDPDGYSKSPLRLELQAVPNPGAVFSGWFSDRQGYGFNSLPGYYTEPETFVARFTTPLNPPPALVIEGSIPTYHYRGTPELLEAKIRVTAASNVTPEYVRTECSDSRVWIWTVPLNDTTPFDVRLKLAADLADANHVPNGEYSCQFRIGRRDGGQNLSIPFKVVLGPYTPEPESTDAVAEAVVDGASYQSQALAAGSIFSIFGKRLATGEAQAQALPLPTKLASTQVRLNVGGQSWQVPLFYVSPSQVNFLVPPDVPSGGGYLSVIRDDVGGPPHSLTIESIAPALFTANADGKGVPSGYVTRVSDGRQERSEISHCPESGPCIPLPLISTDPNEEVFLILYGTGFRNDRRTVPEAHIGDAMAEVTFFGPHPDFAGLDQVNIKIPRALLGSGLQTVVLRHAGKETNAVTVHF